MNSTARTRKASSAKTAANCPWEWKARGSSSLSKASIYSISTTASRSGCPWKGAPATLNDTPRHIREIEVCRVGELGRWTMMPYAWQQDVEFTWHISTPIVRIVQFLYRAEPVANGEADTAGTAP